MIALACLQGVAAYYLGWTGIVLHALSSFQTAPSLGITMTIVSLLALSAAMGFKAAQNVYCAYTHK